MSEVIRLLPDHIANQIAAGEVIQRPASVVKELVENAIDAGSVQIDVIIKDAGKTLIQVLDNGCGMSEMDARMAFERHATSKLASADDLFALKTKGFRGEALASIAAIAHVELKTRQEDNEVGTSVVIEGSRVTEQSPVTCKQGSSFEVKNLFFNVPARRNFLKSDAIEFKHIEEEFLRIALAHPDRQLSLQHNGNRIYHLEKANLRKRIVDAFGRGFNDKLVPVDETTGIVRITGFVGKPEFAKKTRGEQYLFVNDRFFKDTYFNHAISQAFDGLLASKTFPSYFIYMYVDPAAIDVNVHPTKTEIKFDSDREIYAILRSSVKQGLGKFNVAPALDFEQETVFDIPYEMRKQPAVEPVIKVNPDYNPFDKGTSSKSNGGFSPDPGKKITYDSSSAMKKMGFGGLKPNQEDWDNFYKVDEIEEEQTEVPKLVEDVPAESRKHFIIHGNFLMCSMKSGIMVIHYKRARERIVYDEIMQSFLMHPIHSQQLLFPVQLELPESEKLMWEENKLTLQRLGFHWEVQELLLSITGIPAHLNDQSIHEALELVRTNLMAEQLDKGEIAHTVIASVSAAVAAQKTSWNDEACNQLVENLFQCEDHQYSPSGKLIINTITTADILQKF